MSAILVLDEARPIAGKVKAYRDAYLQEYAPGARRRGMTLQEVRITPPFVLSEGGNRLTFVWSIPDVPRELIPCRTDRPAPCNSN